MTTLNIGLYLKLCKINDGNDDDSSNDDPVDNRRYR